MSGYVASARIVRVAPRLVRANGAPDRSIDGALALQVEDLIVEAHPPAVSTWGRVGERVAAAGDRWSQLTFYLFDPNSWR